MVGIASNAVPHYYFPEPSVDKIYQEETELSYRLTEYLLGELLRDFVEGRFHETRLWALRQLKNWLHNSTVRLALEIKSRLDKDEVIRTKCREILVESSD